MLITFKSRAGGDVIMFGKVGQQMLQAMGKDPNDARGIVTVEQLDAAMAALQAAVAADRQQREAAKADDDEEEEPKRGMAAAVSFAQRAIPLIDLLTHAKREEQPVLWES
ncbi:MAG: DUF1840 domain-containing protein [Rhodocyclaceae bacterium]